MIRPWVLMVHQHTHAQAQPTLWMGKLKARYASHHTPGPFGLDWLRFPEALFQGILLPSCPLLEGLGCLSSPLGQ